MRKLLFLGIGLFLLTLIGVGILLSDRLPTLPSMPSVSLEDKETVSVHSIVVEKITGMAKMQLVKIDFQDVITHEVQVDYLPDPKVMLKVYGETVGCVDFAKIDSADVHVQGDTILIDMPAPEICYSRIDNKRSEIVDTWYTAMYKDGQTLIDQAYEIAEEQMEEAALMQDIYGQTEAEAQRTLLTTLKAVSQKQVILRFPVRADVDMSIEPVEQRTQQPEAIR